MRKKKQTPKSNQFMNDRLKLALNLFVGAVSALDESKVPAYADKKYRKMLIEAAQDVADEFYDRWAENHELKKPEIRPAGFLAPETKVA